MGLLLAMGFSSNSIHFGTCVGQFLRRWIYLLVKIHLVLNPPVPAL
jgi:hypothetical protein